MNRFALLLADDLAREDYTLEELPDLLLDAGADDYDAHPGVLAATLGTGPTGGLDSIGWHPNTWAALARVLGDPPKEEILPLLKAFYFFVFEGDGESAA